MAENRTKWRKCAHQAGLGNVLTRRKCAHQLVWYWLVWSGLVGAAVRMQGHLRGACLLWGARGWYMGAGYMPRHVSTAAAQPRRCSEVLTRLHWLLWQMGPRTPPGGSEIY